ncbi:MAG TPA: XRE family transcriptional regulator [Clostridiaceae bacterium]|nr:XRE family transcriptional regulator [Clostridiaceae bacterium]
MKSRLNREKIKELMDIRYKGNYNKFSRELGIDPAHLYRFLNTGIGGGKKIIFSLMDYCEKNKLDYKKFIEL